MLDGLDEYCTQALAEHGCPSVSVAVAERGEVVLTGAYGLADVAGGRAATPDTVYGLASVTKPITATAVCLAADEGLLDLDAPVPGDFQWPAPTARQLLQHRGGLGAYYAWDYGDGERPIDADRYHGAVPQAGHRLRVRQPRLPASGPAAGDSDRAGAGRVRPRAGVRATRAHRLPRRADLPGPGAVGDPVPVDGRATRTTTAVTPAPPSAGPPPAS